MKTPLDFHSFRVLIVDDNPADGRLARLVLTAELPGIAVDEAATAAAFAERLVEGRFDVAVVERELTWSEGADVVRAIRRTRPNCPVILFASDYRPLDWSSGGELKPAEYLVKEGAGYLQLAVAVRRQLEGLGASGEDSFVTRLPLGAFSLSADGRITAANEAMVRLIGASVESLVGRPLVELLADGSARSALAAALAAGTAVDGLCGPPAGGEGRRWLRLWLWPVVGRPGAPFEGIMDDVSEFQARVDQHHREAEVLRRRNAELERFTSTVSHELQSPLGRISRYTQLLIDRQGTAVWRDLHRILEDSRKAQATIQDLLDYVRSHTNGAPMDLVDFGAAADAAAANLEDALNESNATLTRGPLPALPAHRSRVVRLFENLIGNALKYHGPRLPRIQISAEETGGVWTFSVEDNGVGIAAEDRERIFELFQRAERTSELPGTGVGLAICRDIVAAWGGRIWVEPAPGEGSVFRFTVPPAVPQHSPAALEVA